MVTFVMHLYLGNIKWTLLTAKSLYTFDFVARDKLEFKEDSIAKGISLQVWKRGNSMLSLSVLHTNREPCMICQQAQGVKNGPINITHKHSHEYIRNQLSASSMHVMVRCTYLQETHTHWAAFWLEDNANVLVSSGTQQGVIYLFELKENSLFQNKRTKR